MIFLTVGTTKFSFDRLLEAVDKAMVSLEKREKLVVQKGTSDYQFEYKNCLITKEISFDEMISYFKKARAVITHAGPATIFLALKFGQNKPLVMPRRRKFGEHVNDHQVYFARFLKKKGLIVEEGIGHFIRSPQKLSKKRKILPSKKLITNLIKYTERLK